jgi:transcriptional regulator with PAS, ATPase and Fis domain
VRIIAATNRDLEKAVAGGRFREDLYYRLHVFPIQLPPLRERPVDIPALTAYFLDLFNATLKKTMTGFTPRAMELMGRYSWPGNVRELKNIVERSMVLSKSAVIDIDTLPREIVGLQYGGGGPGNGPQAGVSHKKTLGELEREHIMGVLRAEGNNRTAAAKVLGISRSTLQDKLKKYGVT